MMGEGRPVDRPSLRRHLAVLLRPSGVGFGLERLQAESIELGSVRMPASVGSQIRAGREEVGPVVAGSRRVGDVLRLCLVRSSG